MLRREPEHVAPVRDPVARPVSRRRRILVLAPRDPHPLYGGDRVRIHRICRELARYHDLTLLTLCPSARHRDAPFPDDGVFVQIHRVVLPRWRSCLNTLAALPTREPLQVAYYRSEAFREAVQRLAPSHDAVLAHLIRTADYADDLPAVRILEMTDALSMNMERVASADADYFDLRRLIYSIEAKRLRAHERRVAKGFDLVGLTSKVDKSFLFHDAEDQHERVMVFPNGVDAPATMPPALARRNAAEIVFVGNVGTLQNFDAAWFFAKRVLPLVRTRRPDALFRIVGPIRPLAARRLRALPGVRVEGVVPSLEVALATARIGVCPVRIASGIQNKVLDYFANRLAVVCSPRGFEGIEARAGEHLLLATTAEEWASKVLRLLDEELLAQRLADAGRLLAQKHYRWEHRLRPLIGRLDEIFERHFAPATNVVDLGAMPAPHGGALTAASLTHMHDLAGAPPLTADSPPALARL